jgi:hypothetical protein
MTLNGFVAVAGAVVLTASVLLKGDFGNVMFRAGVMLALSAITRKIFLG